MSEIELTRKEYNAVRRIANSDLPASKFAEELLNRASKGG